MPEPSDETLMRLVKANQSQAMNQLVERYQGKLLHFFYGMSGDRFGAEDLVQTTFLRMYKYRNKYQEGKTLFTWLFQIARNVWYTAYRKQEGKPEFQKMDREVRLPERGSDPTLRFDQQQLLRTALLQLPERERQLVILYHLQGYDYQELSTLFEIPPGTLRVIICRTLKQLGRILTNMGYEHHG